MFVLLRSSAARSWLSPPVMLAVLLVSLWAGLLGAELRRPVALPGQETVQAALQLPLHLRLHLGGIAHEHATDGRVLPGEGCCCASSVRVHTHVHGDGAQPLSWALPPCAPSLLPEDRCRSVWAGYDRPFLPDPLPADLLRPPRAQA